jgi:hypothetical protein
VLARVKPPVLADDRPQIDWTELATDLDPIVHA